MAFSWVVTGNESVYDITMWVKRDANQVIWQMVKAKRFTFDFTACFSKANIHAGSSLKSNTALSEFKMSSVIDSNMGTCLLSFEQRLCKVLETQVQTHKWG